MAREDLRIHFDRIEKLAGEISRHVPSETTGTLDFRADLAGLLVVTIAASYESCVKETLVGFARRHHAAFDSYTLKNYNKLNSRINIRDLYSYTKTFDDNVGARFKILLRDRKAALDDRIGRNIEAAYKQILDWRHDFSNDGEVI